MPPGGWAAPWDQCLELGHALDTSKWTLVGGLMVQLHAAVANLPMMRPTTDVDMLLHVETGAVSGPEATRALARLGYTLQMPLSDSSPAHRFIREREGLSESIDVMVAEHGVSKPPLKLGGRKVFQVPAGTQALKRTIECRVMDADGALVATLSIPSVLAAVVLKAAAYRADSRDRERHLEDAALLSTMLGDPLVLVPQLRGSDRSRIITLHNELSAPYHPAWSKLDEKSRRNGQYALEILASNPQDFSLGELGPAF